MDSSVVVEARAEVCEMADRKRDLQHQLRQEMEMHITEGRASVQRNQERMSRIRQLKEELQKEELNKETDQSQTMSMMDHEKLLERRTRLKEAHERLIENELTKMEKELQEEQVGGVEGEMSYLRRERLILVLQIEALRRENQQANADLEEQNQLHQQELNLLREESLQVFRAFRDVLEEQKRMSESRYRTLLIEAIQDAVHLSSQNLQLQEEIQQLRRHPMNNSSTDTLPIQSSQQETESKV